LVESQEASARLLREARAAARINHNNIVQVFDFGYIETGEPFIVMELLRGESLGDRLERAIRIPAASAVEILVPVAHALAAAHSKGIVHRDLKPWNIFLAVDESNVEIPKVVDFGIAKMAVRHDPRVTQEGHVIGSPEYLSPEQARGEDDIDARADVWALSVTLYETITGKLPFEHEVYNRLLRKIVEDEPVPTTEHAAGDSELWAIIRKGLQKNRELRWQSAAEMGAALEKWLEGNGVFTTSGTFRRMGDKAATPEQPMMTLSAGDIETASREALPRERPADRRRWMLVASLAIVAVVSVAITWAVMAKRPMSAPTAPPASAPVAATPALSATPAPSAPLVATSASSAPTAAPPATMSAPPVVEATASATPPVSVPPVKNAAGPVRAGPAPSRAVPTKTTAVPAIPTEPNF
jgi:serine/threonine-protein kinase